MTRAHRAEHPETSSAQHMIMKDERESEAAAHVADGHSIGIDHAGQLGARKRLWLAAFTDQSISPSCCTAAVSTWRALELHFQGHRVRLRGRLKVPRTSPDAQSPGLARTCGRGVGVGQARAALGPSFSLRYARLGPLGLKSTDLH